jgi:hypothetical protein
MGAESVASARKFKENTRLAGFFLKLFENVPGSRQKKGATKKTKDKLPRYPQNLEAKYENVLPPKTVDVHDALSHLAKEDAPGSRRERSPLCIGRAERGN